MTRTIRSTAAAVFGAALLCAAAPVRAGDTTKSAAPASAESTPAAAGPEICVDEVTPEQREAALRDLGRQLDAAPKPGPEVRVLNRTGLNYGKARQPAAAAVPAPPAQVAPAP